MTEENTTTDDAQNDAPLEAERAQAEATLGHIGCPRGHQPARFIVDVRPDKDGVDQPCVIAEAFSSAHKQLIIGAAKAAEIKLRVEQVENSPMLKKHRDKKKPPAARKRRSLKRG